MNVYVENILAEAASLSAANLAPGYTAENLYHETLSNNVVFDGTDTVITAEWGLNTFADSVALLETNWTIGSLSLESQGLPVYDETITSRGKHTIIKLPELFMVTRMTLELSSMEALEAGILFVGKRIALPLFNTGLKYKLNVGGSGDRTRYGIAYGLKKPPLRSFAITFQDIDTGRRELMERYIAAVQSVTPHLVEPYEEEDFPPLYATLEEAGEFTKEKYPGFVWSSALSYKEAR